MNRFLFAAGLCVLFGCGARTESFTDLDGTDGQSPGAGGAQPNAGAPNAAGAPHAGAPGVAGGLGVGGAPYVAGAPGVGGGAPHVAGAPGVGGGAPYVGGAPGVGGAPHVAGGPSVGGATFAGAPGVAGSGGAAGVVQACQAIAGSSCQKCLCTSCSTQLVECFSNFGCALILACAEQTGCQGVACYSSQTCKPVIDQLGGLTGSAMKDVVSLLTCSAGSQNSCSCN